MMAQDELVLLRQLIRELIIPPVPVPGEYLCACNFQKVLTVECDRVKRKWNTAAFSAMRDAALNRYFSFHLDGIRSLLDTLYHDLPHDNVVPEQLLNLIAYQQEYFLPFFNTFSAAPLFLIKAEINQQRESMNYILPTLRNHESTISLSYVIKSYFDTLFDEEFWPAITFYSLWYSRQVIGNIKSALNKNNPNELFKTLIAIDFNHLGFFQLWQQRSNTFISDFSAKEKLAYWHVQKIELALFPNSKVSYDSRWPSLKTLLTGWMDEEIKETEKGLRAARLAEAKLQKDKLPLNLSVAHIVCLVKLLIDDNRLGDINLQELFRFISRHFRTKRQAQISTGSLSKEYYSTSQKTAAVVLGILDRWAEQINKNFFPS